MEIDKMCVLFQFAEWVQLRLFGPRIEPIARYRVQYALEFILKALKR